MIRLKSLLNEDILDSSFLSYIKDVEGAVKDSASKLHKAYKDSVGVWTIGYGHTGDDVKPATKWPESKAEYHLKADLYDSINKVKEYVSQNFPGKVLDTDQLKMLTDIAFNVGSLRKFPTFTKAVVNKNWKEAVKHYKRYAGGKELTRRNTKFYDTFLKPKLTAAAVTSTSNNATNVTPKVLTASDLIGKTIYPKPGTNYANVRETAVVDNGMFDNLLTTVYWPNAIGIVKSVKKGEDSKQWCYVKLQSGEYGYVRTDVIKTTNSKYHIVKAGDTLLQIAVDNGLTLDGIIGINGFSNIQGQYNDSIQPGQKIRLR